MAAAPAESPGVVCDRLGREIPVPRRGKVAGALAEGGGSALPDVP